MPQDTEAKSQSPTRKASLGDQIYGRIEYTRGVLFHASELHQFALEAFHYVIEHVGKEIKDSITFSYPVGRRADKTPIVGTNTHTKESFIRVNQILANVALPVQGIFGLCTSMEMFFSSIIRIICLKYPQKVGVKKTLSVDEILKCKSIEEVHNAAIDKILSDLAYKSPYDLAVAAKDLMDVDLLTIPEFHTFIEMKATRDIHIHNAGIVNSLYIEKAGTHRRADVGEMLPISNDYYLDCYEACHKIIESLEIFFHEKWPSEAKEKHDQEQKEKEKEQEQEQEQEQEKQASEKGE